MVQNWAIVVGINHYEHLSKDEHLKCAVQDAEAVRAFLCKSAGFPSNNVLLCSDHSQSLGDISTRPSRTNLRRILQEKIPQEAAGADNFWFFFAGHGISKNYQDYLLPCDGYPYDEESAISVRFVVDCLRRCRAQNIVLALDMCRESKPQSTGSRGVTKIGQETIEITQQQGIITIFSCSVGAESYEIGELEQGAFTYVLLKGLQQHLILRQLEQYLIREVPALNHRYKKPPQIPLVIPEPGWKYDFPLLAKLVAKEGDSKSNGVIFSQCPDLGNLNCAKPPKLLAIKLQHYIREVDKIIRDSDFDSLSVIRNRVTSWKEDVTDFLSESVGEKEAYALATTFATTATPKGSKDPKARSLSEAIKCRKYLVHLLDRLQ